MKFTLAMALGAAATVAAGLSTPAQAQEQVTETLTCRSNVGERASCTINGEVVSAGIQRQIGESAPCFLNYTWGFEENGLWTGNGCSAEFVVTVERATPQRVIDPEVLRGRLRESRQETRQLRRQLTQEQETRALLEAELADAQAALRDAEAGRAATQGQRRKRQAAIRSVAQCSNRAVREAEKFGASKARVTEIVSARPMKGVWLVIGRMSSELNGDRSVNYFRCFSESGKIVNFENSI
jgi:regulator of protease activity HflC (stomatin/prohibitin superfamily)